MLYLFGQLDDADVEWLGSTGQRVEAAAGTAIIRRGKAIDRLYIVLAGELSVCSDDAGKVEIARLSSGEIVGEMSFVDSRPPSATVAAREAAVLLSIPRSALESRMRRDATFGMRFYRAIAIFLSDRLRETSGRLGYGAAKSGPQAIADLDELSPEVLDTLHLAGERFERLVRRTMGR